MTMTRRSRSGGSFRRNIDSGETNTPACDPFAGKQRDDRQQAPAIVPQIAHLGRTGVGALTLDNSVTLDALSDATEGERDAWLQPVDALLSTFPLVQLNEDATRRFLHGQRLKLSELTITDEAVNAPRVRVYAAQGRLLGVAKQGEGVLAPERLVVTTES